MSSHPMGCWTSNPICISHWPHCLPPISISNYVAYNIRAFLRLRYAKLIYWSIVIRFSRFTMQFIGADSDVKRNRVQSTDWFLAGFVLLSTNEAKCKMDVRRQLGYSSTVYPNSVSLRKSIGVHVQATVRFCPSNIVMNTLAFGSPQY